MAAQEADLSSQDLHLARAEILFTVALEAVQRMGAHLVQVLAEHRYLVVLEAQENETEQTVFLERNPAAEVEVHMAQIVEQVALGV
jgi:hypothetical protein